MLFDLKGKRRRAVQGTYLTLAVLMGAGLVLFGVGSSVNGGLGDLFSGGSGSNHATSDIQKQIDRANRQLAANPRDSGALRTLVLDHYRLANATANPANDAFTAQGKQELALASSAWQRYLQIVPNPDPALARYMLQAYSIGLNQPAKATQAAEIIAAAQPSSDAYVAVVGYAALAHDTRTVQLASAKALALAAPSERATVKQKIAQAKAAPSQSAAGQSASASGP